MKRGTTDHPKMLALAQALHVPIYSAIGLMESLWHWTSKYAPAGNVGKWESAVIAKGLGWDRDPDELVDAMVECGWLEQSAEHRLIVHDWSQHADDAVHRSLARSLQLFADGGVPNTARLDPTEKEKAERAFAKLRRVRTPGARRAPKMRTPGALPEPVPEPLPEPRRSPALSSDTCESPLQPDPAELTKKLGTANGHGNGNGNGNGAHAKPPLREIRNPLRTPLAIAVLRGWQVLADKHGLRSGAVDAEKDRPYYDAFVAMLEKRPKPDEWGYLFDNLEKQPTCLGKGSDGWKVSLQWLVANEDNWLKAFRGRWRD